LFNVASGQLVEHKTNGISYMSDILPLPLSAVEKSVVIM